MTLQNDFKINEINVEKEEYEKQVKQNKKL